MTKKTALALMAALCLSAALFAQQASPTSPAKPAATPPPPTSTIVLDRELSTIERELVPLAEAMPADKYDFKPSGDGFKTVRMFKQQIGHIATALEILSSSMLGEADKYTEADELNGPDKLKTKEDYVAFLKEAFAHAHKAIASVNDKNLLEAMEVKPWKSKGTRMHFANVMTWHSFDHYGQLVVYLRLNNIVPPASRG